LSDVAIFLVHEPNGNLPIHQTILVHVFASVCLFVCLSVCLSVSKITQLASVALPMALYKYVLWLWKRVHWFGWNVACRQMS